MADKRTAAEEADRLWSNEVLGLIQKRFPHIPMSEYGDEPRAALLAFARDVTALAQQAEPVASAPAIPDGFVVAPHYRGYAHLGIGAYLLNNSAAGTPAELVISIATEEEKAGRVVGDEQENKEASEIHPDAMAVRICFENVAGLDALEKQLRRLREEHFSANSEHGNPLRTLLTDEQIKSMPEWWPSFNDNPAIMRLVRAVVAKVEGASPCA